MRACGSNGMRRSGVGEVRILRRGNALVRSATARTVPAPELLAPLFSAEALLTADRITTSRE
jgi:hypothetical protein